jgi:hypothetical protein
MINMNGKTGPERFISELKAALGPSLKSVVLYGSAASEHEAHDQQSDFNLLILVDDIGAATLARMTDPVRRWVACGNHSPMVFTDKRLRESCDVFPIEMLDIRACHKVLYGEDWLSNLEISRQNLRHQVEYELRSKVLKLRDAYILHSTSHGRLAAVLVEASTPILVVFRAALRLYGPGDVPSSKSSVLGELKTHIPAFDRTPFDRVMALRSGTTRVGGIAVAELFADYLRQIELVTDAVDAM